MRFRADPFPVRRCSSRCARLYAVVWLGCSAGTSACTGPRRQRRAAVSAAAWSLVIILRRRRSWAGCQRLFWDTFAVGMAFWIIGHVGWAVDAVQQPIRVVAAVAHGLQPVRRHRPLIALLARPHRGVRSHAAGHRRRRPRSYGLLAVFVYSYFVLVPSVVPRCGRGAGQLLLAGADQSRLAPARGLLAAAWFARDTAWQRHVPAAGDRRGNRLLPADRHQPGDRARRLPASARSTISRGSSPLLCLRVGGADRRRHPKRRAEAVDVADRRRRRSPFSAVPVLLIPLIGYGMLCVQPLGAPTIRSARC